MPTASGPSTRPPLTRTLSAQEFARWYWNKRELQAFAAELGVGTSGAKAELAERIRATLAGEDVPRATRRPSRDALTAPLTPETTVPEGQRMTAVLRAYLAEQCPGFRFDQHMRDLLAAPGDKTLAELVAHWHATRTAPRPAIAAQFEYNAFVRAWRTAHPGANHAEVVAAWTNHRALPADERPEVG